MSAWRRTLRECQPEVRLLLELVELGCALIIVGLITLIW